MYTDLLHYLLKVLGESALVASVRAVVTPCPLVLKLLFQALLRECIGTVYWMMDNKAETDLQPSKQFASIDDAGNCTSCGDATATDCSLICLFCKSGFHGVCKDAEEDQTGNDIICTRTFYRAFAKMGEGINTSRFGTFTFVCDMCLTNYELKEASTSESKVDLIDKRVNNLSKSMDEMKDLLSKVVEISSQKPSPEPMKSPTSAPTFSEILQKPLKRSVLILESNADSKKTDADALDKIIVENAIHVDRKYENKKGETVVVCPTEQDRAVLSDKLTVNLPKIKTHQPPDRCPTISVSNLTESYEENELGKLILQAHPNINSLVVEGEIFEVMKVKPQIKNNQRFQATIRVGNTIRKIIEGQGDRLYIGSFSCRVFDHFHVKRCNNCQTFGRATKQTARLNSLSVDTVLVTTILKVVLKKVVLEHSFLAVLTVAKVNLIQKSTVTQHLIETVLHTRLNKGC